MQRDLKLFVALSLLTLLVLLLQGRYRPSYLFGGLATLYYVVGLLDVSQWSSSYTNSSLIVLLLLLLVSVSIEKTVIVEYFSKLLIRPSYKLSLFRLGIITPIFSAFLNNTAVVASLMGVIKNNSLHLPSKLLIPLSYFAIAGGTMTLVGTSTNLIVNSFVLQNGLPGLGMFDFFAVGAMLTVAVVFTVIVASRLLPSYKNDTKEAEEHLIELKVAPTSSLIGKSIKDNGLRALEYLFLLEIQRGKKTISPVSPAEILEAEDRLIFSGDIKHIELFQKFDGLHISDGVDLQRLKLVDAIVTPESNLVGEVVKKANFRSKFDAAIVSFKRGSQSIAKIGNETIQAGDRLILAVGNDFKNRDNIAKNFYIFSNIEHKKKFSNTKSFAILSGFATVILLGALGVLSLLKGLLVLLGVLLLTKTMDFAQIKRRFAYDIFIIVGSSLAIAKVLVASGVAEGFAGFVIESFGSFGVYGSFVGIYLLTLLLTESITNNAAAALAFPIAYATAVALDANVMPFVFAVAYGASASFMMPYGYQTNLMVSSLGGYKTTDFVKIGWLVSLVYSAVVLVSVPMVFGF
ncbi:MAG: SLC13 family permease [Campylobacterota bacterium]